MNVPETSPEMHAICKRVRQLRIDLLDALGRGDLHYNTHPLDILEMHEDLAEAASIDPKIQHVLVQRPAIHTLKV